MSSEEFPSPIELDAEERRTRLRRLKAAEDIAAGRAKDASVRYDRCAADPNATKEEMLAALEASVRFHEEAAAACKRLIAALRGEEPDEESEA